MSARVASTDRDRCGSARRYSEGRSRLVAVAPSEQIDGCSFRKLTYYAYSSGLHQSWNLGPWRALGVLIQQEDAVTLMVHDELGLPGRATL